MSDCSNGDSVINIDDKKITIGNAGFIKLVDCMPRIIPGECRGMMCDYAIVQAARVSIDQGIKSTEQDSKLIDFLIKHKHTSPFEMVKFKFHVKCPIFIQRQWIRHRTANVNEISGRYSVLKPEFYIPDKICVQGEFNKQMSGEEIKDPEIVNLFKNYVETANQQYNTYNKLIEKGVSKEMARIGLPLNMYTEFYWCIDLHNLLNFIRLRSAPNAQPEIKLYSDAIKELIRDLCPYTIKSFEKYNSHNDNTTPIGTQITELKTQITELNSQIEELRMG
jgi:thymidylate synthase (FAD)